MYLVKNNIIKIKDNRMGGNVRLIYKNLNKITDVNISIKEAKHICASFSFLYGEEKVREDIEQLEDDLFPEYGCIFMNHDEKFFKSSQYYFDIKIYGIDFLEALGITTLKTKTFPNLFEMVQKGGFKYVDVINDIIYHSQNPMDCDKKTIRKDITQIKNKLEWEDYLKKDLYSISIKNNGRNLLFSVPETVPFFEINQVDMNQELLKYKLPIID